MKWRRCYGVEFDVVVSSPANSSLAFKGIALFTPGGDLVYSIDREKRLQWHLDLCAALQESLELHSPPHFLLPCYTATVDRWVDAATGQVHTVAEAYPRVMRYQALLNTVFELDSVCWRRNDTFVQHCCPSVIETYRQQFPQLWECHDLILPVEKSFNQPSEPALQLSQPEQQVSYILQLFVRSDEQIAAEQALVNLRRTLEQTLQKPYTLQLIDVTKYPEQAEVAQITATPSLVRAWPLPVRRLAGDLASPERLAQLLE